MRYLRDVREERKAIITISEGWRLFRPAQSLMPDTSKGVPGMPPLGVDPGSGKITTKNPNNPQAGSQYICDRDRMNLAQIDDESEFRQLLDEANRANASFYPIDPRGLAVFDSSIAKPSCRSTPTRRACALASTRSARSPTTPTASPS